MKKLKMSFEELLSIHKFNTGDRNIISGPIKSVGNYNGMKYETNTWVEEDAKQHFECHAVICECGDVIGYQFDDNISIPEMVTNIAVHYMNDHHNT